MIGGGGRSDEARKEAAIARRRWPLPVSPPSSFPFSIPFPVLSFLATAFLSSLLGTFTARGFHQTLVVLEFIGDKSTQQSPRGTRTTHSQNAGPQRDSTDGEHQQPGDAGDATTAKATSASATSAAIASGTTAVEALPVLLWPMPRSASRSNWTLALRPRFRILPRRSLPTLVTKAAARLKRKLFAKHSAEPNPGARTSEGDLPILLELRIQIRQPDGPLRNKQVLGTNESYSLHIDFSPGSQPTATLEAASALGALRGLETFRQLCRHSQHTQGLVLLEQAPWVILDEPRFPHRALALDTSQRLLPIPGFHQAFQIMERAKLNVLHWKLSTNPTAATTTTSNSSNSSRSSSSSSRPFPIDLPSLQAASSSRRASREAGAPQYTAAEVTKLVRAAEERGITLVPEIDIPGGVEGWGLAHPGLWPSDGCRTPLDVSRPQALKVLGAVLKDLRALFPGPAIHLGGSAPNLTCWHGEERGDTEDSEEREESGKRGERERGEETEESGKRGDREMREEREEGEKGGRGGERGRVAEWLAGQQMSAMDGYAQFVVEAVELASAAGWGRVVLQEDAFLHFGERLGREVLVENSFQTGVKDAVVSIGLQALVTFPPQAPGVPGAVPDWWEAHSWEPCANLNAIRFYPQVLGGVINLHPFLDFPGQFSTVNYSTVLEGQGLSSNGTTASGEGQVQGLLALAALAEKLWSSSESLEGQGREAVGQRLARFMEDLDITD